MSQSHVSVTSGQSPIKDVGSSTSLSLPPSFPPSLSLLFPPLTDIYHHIIFITMYKVFQNTKCNLFSV